MNYFSSAAAKVAATANAAIVAGAEVAKTTSNSVQHLVDEKYGVSETKCTKCGAVSKGGISNLAVNISKGQLHNFQRCLVCDRQYCPLCISRSRYKIPGNRLHKNSESKKSDALPVRGWCCCDCEEPLIDIWKRDFKSTIGRLFDMNVMTFLSLVGRGPLDYKAVAYSFFRVSSFLARMCDVYVYNVLNGIIVSVSLRVDAKGGGGHYEGERAQR